MVIDDCDIESIASIEAKTDTPLIINANAPLTFAVAAQGFQPVAWGNTEVFECMRVVQHLQFTLGRGGKCFEPTRAFAFEQRLCVFTPECLNHTEII